MRQIDKTSGIVIRAVDFSETSRIVTLFTRDVGKIGALAKGGRRLKGAFEVSLDVLSVCRICVIRKPNAELDLLTEGRLEERFAGLGRDLRALYAGYFLAEVLDGLTQPHDPHPALYDLTVEALRSLSEGRDRLAAVGRHMARLLAELGYASRLDACAACGADVPPAERRTLHIGAGGLLCEECRQRHLERIDASPTVVRALARLGGEEPTAGELGLEPRERGELWRVLSLHVHSLLGRRTKLANMLTF